MKTMIQCYCGSSMDLLKEDIQEKVGSDTVIVHDVPVHRCPHCGQSLLGEVVAKHLEECASQATHSHHREVVYL